MCCVCVRVNIKTYKCINIFIGLVEYKRVDISMVVICYVSDIIGYHRRTPELFNAPLHMKNIILVEIEMPF